MDEQNITPIKPNNYMALAILQPFAVAFHSVSLPLSRLPRSTNILPCTSMISRRKLQTRPRCGA